MIGNVRSGRKDAPPCHGRSNFQKPYPPEFRRQTLELYRRSGRPLKEIARDLGVSSEWLRLWVKQAGIDAGEREGLSSKERDELRRLRRETREKCATA